MKAKILINWWMIFSFIIVCTIKQFIIRKVIFISIKRGESFERMSNETIKKNHGNISKTADFIGMEDLLFTENLNHWNQRYKLNEHNYMWSWQSWFFNKQTTFSSRSLWQLLINPQKTQKKLVTHKMSRE